MKIKSFLILLVVLIISCTNNNKGKELPNSEHQKIPGTENQENVEKTKLVTSKIMEQLQGRWKEMDYPYRTAEFVGATVKFVEEGTENKPRFENFEVSEDCQFDNNNIMDLQSSDIILSLPETKRCENLKVSKDTLSLHGFSTNSNEDYNIVYLRLK